MTPGTKLPTPTGLPVKLLFCYPAPLDNAPQGAQWQLLPFVVGNNHLLPRIAVAPLLMTAPLGDEYETVPLENLVTWSALSRGNFGAIRRALPPRRLSLQV